MADPLDYYLNNTCKSRSLIASAVEAKVPHFIFSSTAAVYGMPKDNPVGEDAVLEPISPYGTSKLMTELMLRDTAKASDLGYVALRYFNVAGADPKGRSGQSTARHPSDQSVLRGGPRRAALSRSVRADYPTPDGTCIRDYIHVTDLVRAYLDALNYLRAGGPSGILNCGYGTGHSVLEAIASVKRVSGSDFPVRLESRRPGDPPALVAKAGRIGDVLGWAPELNDLDTIINHALFWQKRLKHDRAAS